MSTVNHLFGELERVAGERQRAYRKMLAKQRAIDDDPNKVQGSVASALYPFRSEIRQQIEEKAQSQEKVYETLVGLRAAYAANAKKALNEMPTTRSFDDQAEIESLKRVASVSAEKGQRDRWRSTKRNPTLQQTVSRFTSINDITRGCLKNASVLDSIAPLSSPCWQKREHQNRNCGRSRRRRAWASLSRSAARRFLDLFQNLRHRQRIQQMRSDALMLTSEHERMRTTPGEAKKEARQPAANLFGFNNEKPNDVPQPICNLMKTLRCLSSFQIRQVASRLIIAKSLNGQQRRREQAESSAATTKEKVFARKRFSQGNAFCRIR